MDLLKLELRTVVTHGVGAGNQTRSFERAASALTHWANSLAPVWCFCILESILITAVSVGGTFFFFLT